MRKLIFICTLMLASATALAVRPAADEEQPYMLLVNEAQAAVEAGDYQTAANRLTDALPLAPDQKTNLQLRNSLAMIYGQMGNETLAAKTFNDVLAVDSINQQARYYLGMMAMEKGNYKEAEKQFDVLRQTASNELITAAALGLLYAETSRPVDALPYLKRALDEAPALEYYTALGSCYLSLSRYVDASEIIARGLNEYPNSSNLYLLRSRLHRLQYRNAEADADAKRARNCTGA